MPRTVKQFPASAQTGKKPSHYDRYFDGNVWEISAVDEPHTNLVSLRYTLMRRARRKGLKIRTSLKWGPNAQHGRLFVQITGPREAPKEVTA